MRLPAPTLALILLVAIAPGASPASGSTADPGTPATADAQPEAASSGSGARTGAEPPGAPPARRVVVLGPAGHDAEGNPGRVHTVATGDTLWDISEAYLGTPWVWPSVWRANRDIANPHRIYPGDRLWISAKEMRRVSDEEAERLLAPEAPPAAIEDAPSEPKLPDYRMSAIEATGVVTRDELDAATSILESPRESIWLAQMDTISIGLGAGEVEVGDQFTIFRPEETAYDPEKGRYFGKFVKVLGWAQITEVHGETASAEIVASYSEIKRGDRLVPRDPPIPDIDYRPAPAALEGQLLYFPASRPNLGAMDVVYLNRGDLHGVEVGNRLDVYRSGDVERDPTQGRRLRTPDRVIGELLVIKVNRETAVAVVTKARTEFEWGDRFRAHPRESASR